ncbi:MAG: DUF433 domain-containing protein [Planctomycetes bacterium]|nr:DUF433 domain-containing protein [Planctomycetota bacterium]
MTPVISQHIAMLPSANHGEKAVIAGTRIRILDIYVWHELQGRTPSEIVADFPQLTKADIHAAMTYYWDNEELIQQQMKRGEEIEAEMRKLYPSKISRQIKSQGKDGDSISS